MNNPNDMRYIELEVDISGNAVKHWAAETTAVRFGLTESESYTFPTAFRGVFDSTSSLIRVPPSAAEYFFHHVGKNINTFYQSGWTTVVCDDESLSSIYFLVGGYWMELHPFDYAIDISAA